MSTPFNSPKKEHPSTYFVQDQSSEEEMLRLQIQDQMVTAGMGGVLPEQPDPAKFQRILDVGCGTGGWLIETAKTYPGIKTLVGVDISRKMIEYAREQAILQGVSERVEFLIMDALLVLGFPPDHFDLVNHRFGSSYLRTWEWPKILNEYQRVTRPGGVIRCTEFDIVESNSPAHQQLSVLGLQVLHQSGHFFANEYNGVTSQLARLLHQYGIQNVQTRPYTLIYRAGTPEWQSGYDDTRHFFRTVLPFLRKWTRVTDDYEVIYQQMLKEMHQPDFLGTWKLLTAWGTKSYY